MKISKIKKRESEKVFQKRKREKYENVKMRKFENGLIVKKIIY